MTEKQKIPFHYIKSNFFRVIHADGAVGGVTPSGDIFFSLWSQRNPIPKLVVHELGEEGTLGEELLSERETRQGLVREVEIGVGMSPETARGLVEWLTKKLELIQKVEDTQQKVSTK